MKKLGIVLAGSVLLVACGQDKAEIKTDDQKASYALGFRSAEQMRSLENLDLDAMVAGLRDGFKEGGESRLGEEDLDQLIRDFQGRMIAAEQKKMEEKAGANLEATLTTMSIGSLKYSDLILWTIFRYISSSSL